VGSGYNGYSSATVTVTNSNEQKIVIQTEVPMSAKGFADGLMFREQLDIDKGMLFAYPDLQIRKFWMKNTLIPLDILFIDENFVIRTIHHATPCGEEPCITYESDVPVVYVLEIKGNLTEEKNIKIGDQIEIRGLNDKR